MPRPSVLPWLPCADPISLSFGEEQMDAFLDMVTQI
jgi:hypothetical protein